MVEIVFSGFDWDQGNINKCQKHGLSLEDIESFLLEGNFKVFPDGKHSLSETRLLAIGLTKHGKPMFAGFVLRSGKLRVITARYMHKKEYGKYA
jgi:uncharacterized DUF497 family protein